MSARKRYLVIPGWIDSKTDRDRHWIGFSRLVQLYGVDPAECINDHETRIGDGIPSGLIVLAPNYDGDYSLPSANGQSEGK